MLVLFVDASIHSCVMYSADFPAQPDLDARLLYFASVLREVPMFRLDPTSMPVWEREKTEGLRAALIISR